jgi:hypothetical protein
MKTNILYLLLIILFITACRKDKSSLEEITQTYIEGHVVNIMTWDSIPDAKVEL